MKKYGGLGRLRRKCIKHQCLRLSRIINVQNLSQIQGQSKLNSAGTEIDETSSLNSTSGSMYVMYVVMYKNLKCKKY